VGRIFRKPLRFIKNIVGKQHSIQIAENISDSGKIASLVNAVYKKAKFLAGYRITPKEKESALYL
jgi:hypothetical protein